MKLEQIVLEANVAAKIKDPKMIKMLGIAMRHDATLPKDKVARLGPKPDDDYTVEIIYYSRIQPLDSSNQENLITREAPQALLFGTLLQTQGFLKSPDKLQIWSGMYDKAMAALKAENASRNVDRNTSVMEP